MPALALTITAIANDRQDLSAAQPPSENRNRSRSPSPPAARSPKRRRLDTEPSLPVTLPIAVNIEETSGLASIANTANPDKKSTPRATQIPHVGTVFRHRRGLLLRNDNPYICALCGTGFPHPKDVWSHFNGHPSIPGRGCWKKHGSKAGVTWDEHASCKIQEDDLRTERCREGWVIVDRESWTKVEAAAEEGRKFKRARAGEDGGAVGTKREREVVAEPVEQRKVEASEKREPPKRKVVRAGDETETDVGGRRR